MSIIEIRYKLTLPEFMAACSAHWKAHRQSTLSNVIAGVAGIIIGVAMLAFIFWFALALMISGGILLLVTWTRAMLCRRAFRETRKYTQDISVSFSDDIIHVESAEGKSDLNWGFFSWHLDTPEYVLLYMTKRNFSVIPKSAFADKQSITRFRELVESKLKKIR